MKALYRYRTIIIYSQILLLLSSCGTFTKMRYSRGYKANIEFNFGKKDGKEERHIAAKAKKHQNITDSAFSCEASISEAVIAGSITIPPIKNERKKFNIFSKKIQIQKTWSILKSNEISQQSKTESKPLQPNIKIAGILFLIYILVAIAATIIIIGLISGAFIIDPILGLVLLTIAGITESILNILSFVSALIGLRRIRKSKGEFRGTVLAIFIILWFYISVFIPLVALFFI